jgi:hypothetical protein
MDGPMCRDGVKAGIREKDVEPAFSRRVPFYRRAEVGEKRRERVTHGIASYEPR